VVAGNYGFSIAPTRPEHYEVTTRTLERRPEHAAGGRPMALPSRDAIHPTARQKFRRSSTNSAGLLHGAELAAPRHDGPVRHVVVS